MGTRLILLGAGGHAHVLLDALRLCGTPVASVASPHRPQNAELDWVGNDEALTAYPPTSVLLVNGIGSVKTTTARQKIFESFTALGYRFADVVHPNAIISAETTTGGGIQLLAGVVVGPQTHLGDNIIVNTRAVVEHGCCIGHHTHIATGAILCGDVEVGEGSHVGAGAVINQGIKIGDGATVASGAVVTKDVADGALVAGVPAVPKQRRRE